MNLNLPGTLRFLICCFGIFLTALFTDVYGFPYKKGIPSIKHFSTADYHAEKENWDLLQDSRGILYFANSDGVMEYDGSYWRIIPNNLRTKIRSLAIGPKETIYVGGDLEFGYLQADKHGKLQYRSLVQLVPEEWKNKIRDVWNVVVVRHKVYFQTSSAVYLYDKGTIEVIPSNAHIDRIYYSNNFLYSFNEEEGLLRIIANEFVPVYGGEIFKGSNIEFITSFDEKRVLICDENKGFYLYDGDTFLPWNFLHSEYILKQQPNNAFIIDEEKGEILITTQNKGYFIINKNGELLEHMHEGNGLSDNKILSIMPDQNDNLWVCLENGIDYIEYNSPISLFDQNMGLQGGGTCSLLLDTALLVGTTQGIYQIDWKTKGNPLNKHQAFNIYKDFKGSVRFFEKINEKVYFGSDDGLYEIKGKNLVKIFNSNGCDILKPLHSNPDIWLAGSYYGVDLLFNKNGELKHQGKIQGIDKSIDYIEEDKFGNIWLGSAYHGVWKAKLNDNKTAFDDLQRLGFGINDELMVNCFIRVKGELLFGTNNGIYKYDHKNHKFVIENQYKENTEGEDVIWLYKDKNETLWYEIAKMHKLKDNVVHEIGVISEDKSYQDHINNILLKVTGQQIFNFSKLDDKNLIIGTENGFIHFNLNYNDDYYNHYNTLVRKVISSGDKDSLVFGGLFMNQEKEPILDQTLNFLNTFDYEFNTFKFDFSTDCYTDNNYIYYATFLEGLDKRWSHWSKSPTKEYNNLPKGNYIFHVKARNKYGIESKEASFAFNISPPWYETYWWYGLELLILVCLVMSSIIFTNTKRVNKYSSVLILLTLITIFETITELLENIMDQYGETIFIAKVFLNIVLALSIMPIEQRIRARLKYTRIRRERESLRENLENNKHQAHMPAEAN